jgi:hypothetical protein
MAPRPKVRTVTEGNLGSRCSGQHDRQCIRPRHRDVGDIRGGSIGDSGARTDRAGKTLSWHEGTAVSIALGWRLDRRRRIWMLRRLYRRRRPPQPTVPAAARASAKNRLPCRRRSDIMSHGLQLRGGMGGGRPLLDGFLSVQHAAGLHPTDCCRRLSAASYL